nr:hypothetical protein [Rubidibacter lacunae]
MHDRDRSDYLVPPASNRRTQQRLKPDPVALDRPLAQPLIALEIEGIAQI